MYNVSKQLTVIDKRLGAIGQAGQVNIRVRGHLLLLLHENLYIQLMALCVSHRAEQRVLVLTETQNDVNTVDMTPDAYASSFAQVVVVI